ncbi:MAG: hypothetical protein GTN70_08410, partial [Deltaproteobacteria bacterium]|nr:hypothetical protein [Deltaproteobacteria bacterium]
AVTVYGGEIYVIDSPMLTGGDGKPYRGARVQVFDMGGNPTRSFGSYGMDPGQFINPKAITHDEAGRVYVADAYQGVVLCYDGLTGEYLGVVHDPSNPMVTPVGISLSSEGILSVSSQNTSSVKRFGLDSYKFMEVMPLELSFTSKEGVKPDDQAVTVSNSGLGGFSYTASASEPWVVLQNTSGTLGSGESKEMSVGIDVTGLSAGTYEAKITVRADTGTEETVEVTVKIEEALTLSVRPDALQYSYRTGDAVPLEQAVTVELIGDTTGKAGWTAETSAGWLTIEPEGAAGDAVTEAKVRVNPAGLLTGIYTGKVIVISDGALGSPAEV